MSNVLVAEEELKALLVGELGLVDEAEFERARLMATRLKMPLERAVAERGRFPFAFLLEQLAQAWGVGFIDLKVSDVHLEALKTIRDEYAKSHVVVPFEQAGRQLKVAMVNPRDRVLITPRSSGRWPRADPASPASSGRPARGEGRGAASGARARMPRRW